jgi:hypothetical protein
MTLCSSLTEKYKRHVATVHRGCIFIGDVSPMNIFLYSLVPKNIKNYIHRCYVSRCFHRLTKEFTLYSSVLQLYSSVVTDE